MLAELVKRVEMAVCEEVREIERGPAVPSVCCQPALESRTERRKARRRDCTASCQSASQLASAELLKISAETKSKNGVSARFSVTATSCRSLGCIARKLLNVAIPCAKITRKPWKCAGKRMKRTDLNLSADGVRSLEVGPIDSGFSEATEEDTLPGVKRTSQESSFASTTRHGAENVNPTLFATNERWS